MTPARLTKAEVLELARYGEKTLGRRIAAGRMPPAVDRNGDGALFDRAAVLKALGMVTDAAEAESADPPAAQGVRTNPDAFRKARARALRHAPKARGRHLPGVLAGPGAPAPLRLAVVNPAADPGRTPRRPG